jgi:hypothetical protein
MSYGGRPRSTVLQFVSSEEPYASRFLQQKKHNRRLVLSPETGKGPVLSGVGSKEKPSAGKISFINRWLAFCLMTPLLIQ